jgi:hypothetical protein
VNQALFFKQTYNDLAISLPERFMRNSHYSSPTNFLFNSTRIHIYTLPAHSMFDMLLCTWDIIPASSETILGFWRASDNYLLTSRPEEQNTMNQAHQLSIKGCTLPTTQIASSQLHGIQGDYLHEQVWKQHDCSQDLNSRPSATF